MKSITHLIVLALFITLFGQLSAQTRKLYVNVPEENLRNAPKGIKIGSLLNGAEMLVLHEEDNWVKVQITGWMWKPSTTTTVPKSAVGEFRALHILVKTRAEAEEILRELQAGKDFRELASTRSQAPSSAIGGDLGYFNRGDFAPVFENAISALNIDQVSGIVETAHGFNIFKRIN